jgi:hypothetical protein
MLVIFRNFKLRVHKDLVYWKNNLVVGIITSFAFFFFFFFYFHGLRLPAYSYQDQAETIEPIYSVHYRGFLDVQNILRQTLVSPGKLRPFTG